MAAVSHSRQVAGDPIAIWTVLADFGGLHAWADRVDHCCLLNSREPGIGLSRRVQSGRDTFVESITAFDPPRLLAYDISGVPSEFTASNRWDIGVHRDGHTAVTLTSAATVTARCLPTGAERVFAHLVAHRSKYLLDAIDRTLRENP